MNPLDLLFQIFPNGKTVVAGVGLVALGVYQLTQGNVPVGVQSVLAGVAALGIRHAIAKSTPSVPPAPGS